MVYYTDGVPIWNSLDDNTRAPLASELESGYPCGEADQELFNFTAGYSIGQIANVLLNSGITPDFSKLLQLSRAIQSHKMSYAVAGGTANALTATLTPAPSSLTAGMPLALKIGTTNTGAATLNVNALGASAIKRLDGSDVSAGDLPAGAILNLVWTGTNWSLTGVSGQFGLPANVQVFSTPGTVTYTPSAGTRAVSVEVQAGGGGGGGSRYAPGTASVGLAGGGGSYARRYYTAGFSGATVVVGAGGAAGTAGTAGTPPGGNGGNGGTSSFTPTSGTTITCTGGDGGPGGTVNLTSGPSTTTTAAGGSATGGDINIPGGVGQAAIILGTTGKPILAGAAGGCPLGTSPTQFAVNANGAPGLGKGAGGTGGLVYDSNSGTSGGAGAPGVVIITEFK